MVAIVQAEFHNVTLADESTWQTFVLITKGDSGDLRGIGLIKVLWKTVTGLLKQQFTAVIILHYVLHGFWSGRGTGTASLEAKLLKHLMAMREAVLYEVFLDLQKAYAALDQDSCLEIIEAYGVGPRALWLLWTY